MWYNMSVAEGGKRGDTMMTYRKHDEWDDRYLDDESALRTGRSALRSAIDAATEASEAAMRIAMIDDDVDDCQSIAVIRLVEARELLVNAVKSAHHAAVHARRAERMAIRDEDVTSLAERAASAAARATASAELARRLLNSIERRILAMYPDIYSAMYAGDTSMCAEGDE